MPRPYVIFIVATIWFLFRPTAYEQFLYTMFVKPAQELNDEIERDTQLRQRWEAAKGKPWEPMDIMSDYNIRAMTVGVRPGEADDTGSQSFAYTPVLFFAIWTLAYLAFSPKDSSWLVFLAITALCFLAFYVWQVTAIYSVFTTKIRGHGDSSPTWAYFYFDALVITGCFVLLFLQLPQVIRQARLKKDVADELERLRSTGKKT